MKNVRKNAVVLIFALFISILPVYAGGSKDGDSAPQLGQPNLLQAALNQLPALPLAGNNLKFQFGGDTWIAQNNGRNFMGGLAISHKTDSGTYLILKYTHTYPPRDIPGISWIKTGGPSIVIEFTEGPPASMRIVPKDELPAEIAALVDASEKAAAQGSSAESTGGSSNKIIWMGAEWRSEVVAEDPALEKKISTVFKVNEEQIGGEQKQVLFMNVKLPNGNGWQLGQFHTSDELIMQELSGASGVRFKVLGDGKQWILQIPTTEANSDFCYYELVFSTQKNTVVTVDVPFSALKQPSYGKKVPFIKDSIEAIGFQKNSNLGAGASTIKVFDFEMYTLHKVQGIGRQKTMDVANPNN